MTWLYFTCILFLSIVSCRGLTKNDETIFEGDMILTKTMRDRLINNGGLDPPGSSNSSSGVKQEATTPLWQRWKNGIVPYHIAPALRCSGVGCIFKGASKLKAAMREWEKKTCIRFRPKTANDKDWVHFRSSSWGHCAAHVGRVGGEQSVWLGRMCRSKGIIMHEIGHMLGFYHEQSRPDRDDHVTIYWNNIKKKNHHNFRKYKAVSDMGTPYDYDSIMHYGSKDFKKWYKFFKHTIKPKGKGKGKKIGQRKYISKWDAEEMNRYYECPPKSKN